MPEQQAGCENCQFRAKYDANPKSFLGRLWKFHTKFCPGWKAYLQSLGPEQLQAVKAKYNLK